MNIHVAYLISTLTILIKNSQCHTIKKLKTTQYTCWIYWQVAENARYSYTSLTLSTYIDDNYIQYVHYDCIVSDS